MSMSSRAWFRQLVVLNIPTFVFLPINISFLLTLYLFWAKLAGAKEYYGCIFAEE